MKQTGRAGVGVWLFRGGVFFGSAIALHGGAVGTARAQEEAPSKASCAQAYESAQESRAAGQLQETRRRLSVCARPECPGFVQKDCARWLEEVERELPSIVISASGIEPDAASSVRVLIDGEPVSDALSGASITLDPGRHELVAERPGHEPIARVVLAQQGVQNRSVELEFSDGQSLAPAPAALDAAPESSSLRPYAYVAWGVGAVGLGMFAVLGTLGRADERGLKDDCPNATTDESLVAPGVCLKSRADERKDIYEREFLLADIGLAAGIVGAAVGTVLFVVSGSDDGSAKDASADEAGLHLDIAPRVGGGFATMTGSF